MGSSEKDRKQMTKGPKDHRLR